MKFYEVSYTRDGTSSGQAREWFTNKSIAEKRCQALERFSKLVDLSEDREDDTATMLLRFEGGIESFSPGDFGSVVLTDWDFQDQTKKKMLLAALNAHANE
jgi:hypothetical protein